MTTAPGNRTGRRPSVPIAPEVMDAALREVASRPWVEVSTLAVVLGIGLQAAYREAHAGNFGIFRVGNLFRAPTAPLREALCLPAIPALAPASTEHATEAS